MQNKTIFAILCAVVLAIAQDFESGEVQDVPRLPLYIGRGYNLLKANPLSDEGVDPGFNHEVFVFTYDKGQKTEDGKYLLPDNISARKVTSCSYSTSISEYRGTQSYQSQLKTKAQVGGGYKGLIFKASFSTSFTYEKVYNQTIKTNMSITQASASCQCYELSVNLFNINKLADNYRDGVLYSMKNKNWEKFIDQFGTHFVYETVMGGRAIQEIEYSSRSVSEMSSLQVDLNIAAKASFAKFYMDSSFDYKKYEKEISYAQTLSQSIRQLYIGGHPSLNGNISQWLEKIISDPMPITYKVLPLSDLFEHISDPSFDAKAATESFYKGLDLYCQKYHCIPPTPDRPKPKPLSINVTKSPACGGTGGGPFDWKKEHPTINAVSFLLKSDSIVQSIQATLSDGITTVVTPRFGGDKGTERTPWKVPIGEHITQVEYRANTRVDSLTFITNKGNRSPKYGGNGGNY